MGNGASEKYYVKVINCGDLFTKILNNMSNSENLMNSKNTFK